MMIFANNLDPDEAPQKEGLHLRSKLFDTHNLEQRLILRVLSLLENKSPRAQSRSPGYKVTEFKKILKIFLPKN